MVVQAAVGPHLIAPPCALVPEVQPKVQRSAYHRNLPQQDLEA